MLPAVRAGLEKLESALQQIKHHGRAGPLQISTLASFLQMWLLPRIRSFRRSSPGIELRFHTLARIGGFLPHRQSRRHSVRPRQLPQSALRKIARRLAGAGGEPGSDQAVRNDRARRRPWAVSASGKRRRALERLERSRRGAGLAFAGRRPSTTRRGCWRPRKKVSVMCCAMDAGDAGAAQGLSQARRQGSAVLRFGLLLRLPRSLSGIAESGAVSRNGSSPRPAIFPAPARRGPAIKRRRGRRPAHPLRWRTGSQTGSPSSAVRRAK